MDDTIQRLRARLAQDSPLFSAPAMTGQALLAHAAGLATRLNSGDRWVLFDADPAAFLAGLLACWQAGAVPVLPANGQSETLKAIDAKGLISRSLAGFEGPVLDPLGFKGEPQSVSVGDLVLFTSGSTGQPKQVAKTAAQLLTELKVLEQSFGPLEGEQLSTVSHQHIYGLLFRLLWPVMSGAIVNRTFFAYPEQLAGAAETLDGPLHLVSSPAQLERLPKGLLGCLAGKLGQVFSSGGLLSRAGAALVQAELGQLPIEVLGSTETGGVAWRRQEGQGAWTPFAGVHCRLDEEGGLWVDSKVAGGPQAMGDRAELLADGRLQLLGRRDRIVKLEQKRLSLDAMEAALCRHPWVDKARCLLLPGRRQQLGAVLVLTEAGEAQLAAQGRRALGLGLRQALLAHFEPVVLPRRWRTLAAFPVSSQGKIEHGALLALFEEQRDVIATQDP
ncbi:AMP-binding protein [Gallaecimonas kandeliae]|uniref:AMP-binding protein n=1 Tax=Gallaecimonas kandeliae TaxID=3029055 RepID=UPI0026493D6F|nr:AMP-binding protein [Gallaecimonas kandeliae]WKE63998.1 AMP-binding protein [Gallaecimonas kandeliae]